MSSKVLLAIVILFSVGVVIGSYVLISGTDKGGTKITSYTNSQKERPKAQIKTVVSDIGKIKVSEEKYVDFTIKNSGQKPLQLFNMSSSCGCTVGQIINQGKKSEEFGMHSQSNYIDEIGSGKDATVRVIYRPYVMPVYGVVDREVYLSTNDPENPKLVFKIKAYVQ